MSRGASGSSSPDPDHSEFPMDSNHSRTAPPMGINPNNPYNPITVAPILPLTMPYVPGASWLPQYTGESHTLNDFKEKLSSLFNLYPMTEEQKVAILISQLGGAAQREVKSWSSIDKRTVKDIFTKLRITFDTRTTSEIKMRFFSCKQRPQDTVRDFALNLLEAMRVIIQVDPDSVQDEDRMLKEQFVEGLWSESNKAQLRMMALQNPDMSFPEFKDRSIRILREPVFPCGQTEGQQVALHRQMPVSPASTASFPSTVQCAQIQSGDAAELRLQVTELTKQVAALTRTVENLQVSSSPAKIQLASSPEDLPWRRSKSASFPQTRLTRTGRRTTDKFDPSGQPICRRCDKVGHVERKCPLNG